VSGSESVDRDGYPKISFHGKTYRANRLVYQLLQRVSTLPRGRDVHHLCSNRRCIEPTHLEALTHQHNIIQTEQYVLLRNWRLRNLLAVYPQIEFFPVALPSTTLQALFDCRSDNVPRILHTMAVAFPEQFSWRPLRQGRQGRKPAVFELQLSHALADTLLRAEEIPTPRVATLVG
jgi:hypothetical protein